MPHIKQFFAKKSTHTWFEIPIINNKTMYKKLFYANINQLTTRFMDYFIKIITVITRYQSKKSKIGRKLWRKLPI